MKHNLALALTASILPFAALAGFRAAPVADYDPEKPLSLGVSANFTALAGEAREHVFSPKAEALSYSKETGAPYSRRRHQLSRLDWDMDSVTLVGLTGSARAGRLSFNLGGWFGCGTVDDADMNDYDWMYGDHVGWSDYSHSESELTEAWMLDANVSYDFYRDGGNAGYAFVGIRAQRWEWTADGLNDYCYAENGHVWLHDVAHVCDYRQELAFGYLGLGGTWALDDRFSLSAYASWAPAYMGSDHDNHIAVEKDFEGDFDYDDGNVYGAGVEISYLLDKGVSLTLALDWQKATLHEGDLSLWDYGEGEGEDADDSAGFENEYVALTLGINITF